MRPFLPSILLSLSALVSVSLLTGCQTNAQMKQLTDTNKRLETSLAQANQEISALKAREAALSQDLDTTKNVLGVMGQEKQSRVEESSTLRQQTRTFLIQHIDRLKQFLVDANLHDYIGGDLIARKQTDKGPLLVVDFGHPLPRNGQLTGANVFANVAPNKTCKMAVRVLRKIDDEVIVVWEGPVQDIKQAGQQRLMFPVAVGVEKGDYAGFWFPAEVCVGHDKGTGDFRLYDADLRIGSSSSPSRFSAGKEKRMYSLGVFGLLN